MRSVGTLSVRRAEGGSVPTTHLFPSREEDGAKRRVTAEVGSPTHSSFARPRAPHEKRGRAALPWTPLGRHAHTHTHEPPQGRSGIQRCVCSRRRGEAGRPGLCRPCGRKIAFSLAVCEPGAREKLAASAQVWPCQRQIHYLTGRAAACGGRMSNVGCQGRDRDARVFFFASAAHAVWAGVAERARAGRRSQTPSLSSG